LIPLADYQHGRTGAKKRFSNIKIISTHPAGLSISGQSNPNAEHVSAWGPGGSSFPQSRSREGLGIVLLRSDSRYLSVPNSEPFSNSADVTVGDRTDYPFMPEIVIAPAIVDIGRYTAIY